LALLWRVFPSIMAARTDVALPRLSEVSSVEERLRWFSTLPEVVQVCRTLAAALERSDDRLR
jgi:hypothetical protein